MRLIHLLIHFLIHLCVTTSLTKNKGGLSTVAVLVPLLFSLSGCAFFHEEEVLEEIDQSELAHKIAETAAAQEGVPYRLGGCAPDGFDCSGLVLFSFQSHGISLPRTAAEQARVGKKIATEELSEGDILVFSPSFFSVHTAISLGGQEFIHAPGKGRRVERCNLDAPHWQKIFSEVRRIVPRKKKNEKK